MRICWYGFRQYWNIQELSFYHFESVIETIFSQLKHASRGSPTAITYQSARAQLLTKQSVHGTQVQDEYRAAPIFIKESELSCEATQEAMTNIIIVTS